MTPEQEEAVLQSNFHLLRQVASEWEEPGGSLLGETIMLLFRQHDSAMAARVRLERAATAMLQALQGTDDDTFCAAEDALRAALTHTPGGDHEDH